MPVYLTKALCTAFTITVYRGFMHADTKSLDVYRMRFPSRREKLQQRAGLANDRNLLWSWYEPRNFGDWIGPYLFAKMTGRLPLHCKPRPGQRSLAQSTAGVGSILRHIQVADRVTVWGSGIISCGDQFARPREVLAVRGPRTRARLAELGYPLADVFGDPGLLMPLFYTPRAAGSGKAGDRSPLPASESGPCPVRRPPRDPRHRRNRTYRTGHR